MTETVVDIAVGIIGGEGGPYLMEVRPDDRHLGGMLAFPGGKCEAGERPEDALRREIIEEVGLEPTAVRPLIAIPWRYPERSLRLHVYRITAWTGDPRGFLGCEGQQLRWCTLAELRTAPFPPANRGILAALSLAETMVVTASCPEGETGFAACLTALKATVATLPPNRALVQLRPGRDLAEAQWRQAIEVVSAAGMTALTNRLGEARPVPGDSGTVGGVGTHLSSVTLMQLESLENLRPAWVTAAVHDERQLDRANALGVDAIVVSPVLPTASHPHAEPLGWSRFAALAARAQMPVYALGGLSLADHAQVVAMGGQGVAALGAFWRVA